MDSRRDQRIDEKKAAHARFLRGLAHEVRTPLGSILMLTELLADGADELTEKQLGQVRKIRRAAADVSLLIDQVSSLAKVADGRLTASWGAVDLEEVVGELHGETAARAREKGLTFEVRWAPGAPKALSTDRLILRQVLEHLLKHALGATREGGITLTVAAGDGELALAVRDRGAAVPQGEREAFFEPFPAAGARTRRSAGGTALALPLAKALSNVLRGRLELESGDERGVTLTLLLPLGTDPKG